MTESSLPEKGASKRSRVFALIVLALALMTASVFFSNPKETDTIIVTFPTGKAIEAEVADTPEKLLFGLAFRDSLPQDSGMLYIFETSDRHRVRTKGFRIPVDMIWADENKRVVFLVEGAQPCQQDPCPFYGPPPENVRYVIQTAAGFVKQEQVTTGMELKFALRM